MTQAQLTKGKDKKDLRLVFGTWIQGSMFGGIVGERDKWRQRLGDVLEQQIAKARLQIGNYHKGHLYGGWGGG